MEKQIDFFDEYNDPIQYDNENASYIEDIPFLLKWAARTKGPIIDLACGTGRVTIPLANEGNSLIGVDVSKGMLEEAKCKAKNRGLKIKWVEQDCTRLQLDLKACLIYSVGNSFQHFLTNEEQDGFLSSVNRHLEKDGIFIFGSRFPSVEELLQPSMEEFWKSYIDTVSQNKVHVYTISDYDSLAQIQHYITIRRFVNKDGDMVDEKRTKIKLRYVFPREMERLLSNHGFEILHAYSDWNETPLSKDGYQMIYVCKKIG